jgi:outer membrane receptor protein involved in Fe transport
VTSVARPLRLALVSLLLHAAEAAQAQDRADPLTHPIALHLHDATLEQALVAISAGSGRTVRLSYSTDFLPASVRVTISRDRTTVGEALGDVLRGSGLGFVVAATGHVVIIPASMVRDPGGADRGAGDVPQVIERVLVMGTPVAGGQERELPTTVAVLSQARIARERTSELVDLFRSGVPGVVAWELGSSGPVAQVGAVRGSSSFSANYLKAYVDGVELASPYMLFALDPSVIERLEIIQGPQGSAMYGADAISGVAHVITRKGSIGGGWQPRFDVSVSGGSVESEYADGRSATQHHAVAATSGGTAASYRATATLTDRGSHVRDGRAATTTALAAGRVLLGNTIVETTVRTTRLAFNTPVSPPLQRVLGARAVPLIAAAAAGQTTHEQTVGATAIVEPRNGWRHTLVVGFDRNAGALLPQKTPASVADLLLGASEEDARRLSLRYATSLRLPSSAWLTPTITAGVERSTLRRERSGPASVIGAGGSQTAAQRGIALYVDTVSNTGAFGQLKVTLRDALHLVAGVRGERNSSFGTDYGSAWSPMAGAAYVRSAGNATLKLRSAYGRGIRPPAPSARRGFATQQYRQVANPMLAPESQAGVEGGVDVYRGDAFALSLTAFDQRAEGLIQHVTRDPRSTSPSVQQQNVGRISNRGGEAQGSLRVGPISAEGSYARVSSVVRALARSYTGELQVGDRVPEVPSWTGHLALTMRRGRSSGTVGADLLGDWVGYDWLSYYTALSDGTTAPASLRPFWLDYPATARVHALFADAPSERFDWFVKVENLGNRQRDTRDNLAIVPGRTVSVGVNVTTP